MAQDFEMMAGDSKTLNITIQDADGDPVDITDWTFKWQAAKSVSKTALISKTSAGGISIIDPEAGQIEVEIDPADTDTLKGEYYHECEGTDPLGNKATPITGKMTIIPTLIRSVEAP